MFELLRLVIVVFKALRNRNGRQQTNRCSNSKTCSNRERFHNANNCCNRRSRQQTLCRTKSNKSESTCGANNCGNRNNNSGSCCDANSFCNNNNNNYYYKWERTPRRTLVISKDAVNDIAYFLRITFQSLSPRSVAFSIAALQKHPSSVPAV
ncbi:uncharacterized protein LOC143027891 [Oratosquilla oratoria]|uniref:uncharacterized protein LOC143027891 n=1 Tax=Oratosquilla oratoria TaxID=337810 RepID=UPI003F75BE62